MGKQQSRNKLFKAGDYSAPTEPVERMDLPQPPYMDSIYSAYGSVPGGPTVPAAQPYARRISEGAYPSYQPVQDPAYPVLLPPPQNYRGSPPGGSPPVYQTERRRRTRHSPLPGLVGLFLLLIQLVLLVRVLCLLFNVQNTTLWLTLLFAAGDLFVEPMRLLAANINVSVLAGTQLLVILEFLLAILAYGIFSRLLVRLLKALLNH